MIFHGEHGVYSYIKFIHKAMKFCLIRGNANFGMCFEVKDLAGETGYDVPQNIVGLVGNFKNFIFMFAVVAQKLKDLANVKVTSHVFFISVSTNHRHPLPWVSNYSSASPDSGATPGSRPRCV